MLDRFDLRELNFKLSHYQQLDVLDKTHRSSVVPLKWGWDVPLSGSCEIPVEKDAMDGPAQIEVLARVAAQVGEPDPAIAALQKLLSMPYASDVAIASPLTPALLRLDPMFDPLRNDPRFQKLAASPALKSAQR